MTSTSDVRVWVWLRDETDPIPAGALRDGGGGELSFRYGRRYLARPDAVALAPGLPLRDEWFGPTEDLRMPSALRDASPDAWGRRVVLDSLTGTHGPGADVEALDERTYLLESESNRFGAVDFQASATAYVPRTEFATLDELHRAAALVDEGKPLSPALRRALQHGTSMGGARPKATVIDDDGIEYLAKFPSTADPMPVVGAEAASMYLARHAGIDVPDTRVERSLGKDVLLVRRFDRGPSGTRRMALSALTLLGLGEMTSRYGTYPDIHDVIIASGGPPGTGAELFRRIAMNMAISNSDDHLRNHAAFWDGKRLELTPAYDLSPTMRVGETATQALAYSNSSGARMNRLVDLISAAGEYGLSRTDGAAEVDRVRGAISDHWTDAADAARLSLSQREVLWGRQFLNIGTTRGLAAPARRRTATAAPRGNDASRRRERTGDSG